MPLADRPRPEITAEERSPEWYQQVLDTRQWDRAVEERNLAASTNNARLVSIHKEIENFEDAVSQAKRILKEVSYSLQSAQKLYADALAKHFGITTDTVVTQMYGRDWGGHKKQLRRYRVKSWSYSGPVSLSLSGVCLTKSGKDGELKHLGTSWSFEDK